MRRHSLQRVSVKHFYLVFCEYLYGFCTTIELENLKSIIIVCRHMVNTFPPVRVARATRWTSVRAAWNLYYRVTMVTWDIRDPRGINEKPPKIGTAENILILYEIKDQNRKTWKKLKNKLILYVMWSQNLGKQLF